MQVWSSEFVRQKIKAKVCEVAANHNEEENKDLIVVSLLMFMKDVWYPVKEELLEIATDIDNGECFKQSTWYNSFYSNSDVEVVAHMNASLQI